MAALIYGLLFEQDYDYGPPQKKQFPPSAFVEEDTPREGDEHENLNWIPMAQQPANQANKNGQPPSRSAPSVRGRGRPRGGGTAR